VEITNFIQNNSDTCFNELNFKITDREITRAISKLKNGKSCGKDSILNEIIKAASPCIYNGPCIIPVLEKLQSCFNYFYISRPLQWRINFITTLHKKGSVNMPENYNGGIAVSNNLCTCKLFYVIYTYLWSIFASNP
jgi:hypothetical protein